MARVIVALAMSLAGLIAGPHDGSARVDLEAVQVVDAPGVTHLRYHIVSCRISSESSREPLRYGVQRVLWVACDEPRSTWRCWSCS